MIHYPQSTYGESESQLNLTTDHISNVWSDVTDDIIGLEIGKITGKKD